MNLNDPVTDSAADLKIYVNYSLNLIDNAPVALNSLKKPLETFI